MMRLPCMQPASSVIVNACCCHAGTNDTVLRENLHKPDTDGPWSDECVSPTEQQIEGIARSIFLHAQRCDRQYPGGLWTCCKQGSLSCSTSARACHSAKTARNKALHIP